MIYILRHGRTALNKARVMQGMIDCPLNDEGREQAAEVARLFRNMGISFAKVYSSPLSRAVETAQIAAGTDTVITDDRLLEMGYGPYEGADLKNLPPELDRFFSDLENEPTPEGMEPLASVKARLGSFLEELRESKSDGDVLISTHAIALKGALEYLMPDSGGYWWSRYVGNCDVYSFDITDGGFSAPSQLKD